MGHENRRMHTIHAGPPRFTCYARVKWGGRNSSPTVFVPVHKWKVCAEDSFFCGVDLFPVTPGNSHDSYAHGSCGDVDIISHVELIRR